jgi:hypothetical protein
MTREELEALKAKPHGPDVDALIAEIERLWSGQWQVIMLEELRDMPEMKQVAAKLWGK